MNTAKASPPITHEVLNQVLRPHLFPDQAGGGLKTYTILDGAAIPDLLDHLYGDPRPEFVCLYRGELEPDMAECAPYLVQLQPDTPFTDWLLAEGWGKNWGIFALAPVDLKTLRKHFRTFLMVKRMDGKQLYFRYCDPRVLRVFLPTCDRGELVTLFGPVSAYCLEDQAPNRMIRFTRHVSNGSLATHVITVSGEIPVAAHRT